MRRPFWFVLVSPGVALGAVAVAVAAFAGGTSPVSTAAPSGPPPMPVPMPMPAGPTSPDSATNTPLVPPPTDVAVAQQAAMTDDGTSLHAILASHRYHVFQTGVITDRGDVPNLTAAERYAGVILMVAFDQPVSFSGTFFQYGREQARVKALLSGTFTGLIIEYNKRSQRIENVLPLPGSSVTGPGTYDPTLTGD